MPLSSDDFPRAVQLLAARPAWAGTADNRRTYLRARLWGVSGAEHLIAGLDLQGAPQSTAELVLIRFGEAGRLAEGESYLDRLLLALGSDVSDREHAEFLRRVASGAALQTRGESPRLREIAAELQPGIAMPPPESGMKTTTSPPFVASRDDDRGRGQRAEQDPGHDQRSDGNWNGSARQEAPASGARERGVEADAGVPVGPSEPSRPGDDPWKTSPRVTPAQILQLMAAEPRVYVLGSLERRVTLYSQQVRALNLVYSLFQTSHLKAGAHVGIVGAGVSGLTAAAAALSRGCRVTLVEEKQDPLPLLINARHRWLDPTIYDWPANNPNPASLPFLSWRADWGHQVRAQLLDRWKDIRSAYAGVVGPDGSPRLLEEYQVTNARILHGSGKPVLWFSPFDQVEVDCVVLAVGFGIEKSYPPAPFLSYWQGDDLEGTLLARRRFLISGTGDGGLTDVLRTSLREFRHDRVVKELIEAALSPAEVEALHGELRKIEVEARRRLAGGADIAPYVTRSYAQLAIGGTLDDHLKMRQRSDTVTILHGRAPSPLDLGSSILNRFLVSRLLRLRVVDYVFGEIDQLEEVVGPPRTYRAHIQGYSQPLEVDQVVIRHGPASALKRGFPEIERGAGGRLRSLADLDLTRVPIWPPGWW